jgi:hypothetical protein
MTNAVTDENWRHSLIGVSSANGTTPVPVEVDPVTGRTLVDAEVSATGSDYQTGFSASTLNSNVFTIDVSNYRSFAIQLTGTWSATVTIQGSIDNVDFRAIGAKYSNSLSQMYTSTFTGLGMIEGPIFFRYLRLRVTSYGSGTVEAATFLSTSPHFATSVGIDTELPGAGTASDTMTNPSAPFVLSANSFYNPTADRWERGRNNNEGTVLASLARTATQNSPDQANYNARGVQLILNVTAQPGGAETLGVKIQAKDPVSGGYVDIVDSGVLFTAATGAKALTLYPGVLSTDLAAGYVGKSGALPRIWRAVVTHSASGSWTYSLGFSLIL